jgi:glucosamine kinase
MHNNNENQPLFLGIDGGGSKCKAVITTADLRVLGTGISGPGNPLHGFEQAVHSITESALLALADANIQMPLSDLTAGVGLAGVNLPVLFEKMSNWQHPFKQMMLTTDLLIACLGAHRGADGAVIITGTGSCGFAYVDGKELIVGAHGFPHGDKGSGAWFGLQGAKQVLLSLDGLVEPSIMNSAMLKKLNCINALEFVEAIASKPATFYAQLANIVFDAAQANDHVAKCIVNEGAEYINQVARKLWQQKPQRMSMIGGLSVRVIPWLADDIRTKLSEPTFPPEIGAVLYAQKQNQAIQL